MTGYGPTIGRALAALLLFQASAAAQVRPKVNAAVSSGDCRPGVTFSGLASVFGENLSDAEYSASALPLPNKLGSTEVFLCNLVAARNVEPAACVPLGILYAGPTQINVLIPDSLPAALGSSAVFTVRVSGVVDTDSYNATAQYYSFYSPAPRVFFMGYDCFIDPRYQDSGKECGLRWNAGTFYRADRGAITDVNGNLINSARPAKLGEWYVIWLTGLGVSSAGKPLAPVDLLVYNVPVYGYEGDTWFDYGSPDYVGVVPGFVGLYQINFRLPVSIATGNGAQYPPMWPCGNYAWEISLRLRAGGDGFGGWHESSLVQVPIVVSNGDVPCAP